MCRSFGDFVIKIKLSLQKRSTEHEKLSKSPLSQLITLYGKIKQKMHQLILGSQNHLSGRQYECHFPRATDCICFLAISQSHGPYVLSRIFLESLTVFAFSHFPRTTDCICFLAFSRVTDYLLSRIFLEPLTEFAFLLFSRVTDYLLSCNFVEPLTVFAFLTLVRRRIQLIWVNSN